MSFARQFYVLIFALGKQNRNGRQGYLVDKNTALVSVWGLSRVFTRRKRKATLFGCVPDKKKKLIKGEKLTQLCSTAVLQSSHKVDCCGKWRRNWGCFVLDRDLFNDGWQKWKLWSCVFIFLINLKSFTKAVPIVCLCERSKTFLRLQFGKVFEIANESFESQTTLTCPHLLLGLCNRIRSMSIGLSCMIFRVIDYSVGWLGVACVYSPFLTFFSETGMRSEALSLSFWLRRTKKSRIKHKGFFVSWVSLFEFKRSVCCSDQQGPVGAP